ncbi:substrate-binding domain-containing protein [Propionivibrio soli]|uniref:substrate-binding domain-containing protein n=1 Tax=Propionivibrio soli TaxID=2976531 RepID=UPI0021E821B7|nr:substrate-binding domain-containing protein [Propionivibrio soli]
MKQTIMFAVCAAVFASPSAWADPKVVPGPGFDATCFQPWSAQTKHFQWEKKSGPYRIALVNGYVGNLWRIQMVKTAKAIAEKPGFKENIKQFKVISTGTDAATQLGAIEDFINQGYDAIVTIAVSPKGFDRVIRLANKKNVVLVPFDNVLDTDKVMQVNENQLEIGRMAGQWIVDQLGDKKSGKILEVRGLPGNATDRDRSVGFREVLAKNGKFDIVQVVGNWDEGTGQKVAADAIAVHKHFDAIFTQGGSTGIVRAMLDSKHPMVPIVGEAENGFRKQIVKYAGEGLLGMSNGQSPALVAVAMKAAIAALQGNAMPQLISVPVPSATYKTLKDGENYWSGLDDNMFAASDYPPCGITITAPEIMAKDEKND